MDPGWLLCPSFMGEKPLAGMHGYSPEDKDSVAAFMTNTPDNIQPAHLTDMCAAMKGEAEIRSATSESLAHAGGK